MKQRTESRQQTIQENQRQIFTESSLFSEESSSPKLSELDDNQVNLQNNSAESLNVNNISSPFESFQQFLPYKGNKVIMNKNE